MDLSGAAPHVVADASLPDGAHLREATGDDSARLCELFRSIHMKGALDMTQEREPDFFALLRMHTSPFVTMAAVSAAGAIEGCGSIVVRDARVGARTLKVGYLCDLRFTKATRGARFFPIAFQKTLEHVRARFGASVFYTVVIDSNRAAMAALLHGHRGAREAQPPAAVMCPFEMVSLQLAGRARRPERSIARATERDVDELVSFLASRQRGRTLGYVFDEALLRARLATWPGFALDSFFLARDRGGRLVGCTAPWDTSPFKRTRVLGYHGAMRAARLVMDTLARLRGGAALPAPGECFRFPFLTHFEADGDDPAIARDLLRAVHAEHLGRGLHFMSVMVPRGSPLGRAAKGLGAHRTGMSLLALALPGAELSPGALATGHPGFEMALS